MMSFAQPSGGISFSGPRTEPPTADARARSLSATTPAGAPVGVVTSTHETSRLMRS